MKIEQDVEDIHIVGQGIGIFITNALDILGMEKETEKFYKTFCKMTQSKSGMWEQRFYTDGSLAPSWGYQV